MQLGAVGRRLQQGIYKVYTAVKTGLTPLCYKVIGVLHIQVTLLAQLIINLFAKIKLSIKHLVALCITQVPLIKVGLILVVHKVGALGQRLLTIAHQILQRVKQLLKQGN